MKSPLMKRCGDDVRVFYEDLSEYDYAAIGWIFRGAVQRLADDVPEYLRVSV
ncbi:hypothetical protein ACFQX5_42620 [Streptomyces lutosisoli]